MYRETKWQDEIVDVNTGEKLQEGTDQSAGNFNNAEHGITDAHMAQLIMAAGMLPIMRASQVEEKIITLTNSKKIPFNNSQKTVSMAIERDATTYDVDVTVIEAAGTGIVGSFSVTDKLLNGFKIAYDGSASSATIKLTIKGGSN